MRIKNVEQTMRGIKNIEKDKVYIIIDDVTTTGATFLEAKRALKEIGAKNILCIALAHGYKRR
jgi:predicted amidophosphoribosyltransferase